MEFGVVNGFSNISNKESFLDLCRTCLKSHNSFISIFSNNIKYNKTYAEMIMAIAPVVVESSDQKCTTNVCPVCADSICKFYNFQQQCIQADTIIRCGFDRIDSTPDLNIFIKRETYDDTNSRDCEMPTDFTNDKSNIKKFPPEINVKDLLSNLKNKSSGSLISTKVKIKRRSKKKKQNPVSNKLLTIYEARSRRGLIKAAIIEHSKGKPNECVTCNKIYTLQKSYRRHIVTKHVDGPAKPQSCDSCGKSFSRSNFQRHRSTCIGIRFECEVCGKRFTQKGNLTTHTLIHTIGKKPFVCELCGQQYSCKNSLNTHIHNSHGMIGKSGNNKKFKTTCEVCNKTFASRLVLRAHQTRIHTIHPQVKCEYCNKWYRNEFCLNIHQKGVHINSTDYLCNVCGRKLKHIVSYENHMLLHKGEKPHKCQYCGKTFRQLAHVKAHERLHTGEKPYKCDQCSKSFRHKNTYIQHVRTHTGEKPYKCKICYRGFTHITNMKKHVLNHE